MAATDEDPKPEIKGQMVATGKIPKHENTWKYDPDDVYWHEGLFLRQIHFQAERRHTADAIATGDDWTCPFGWGLRRLLIDKTALKETGVFHVMLLQARLPDGTIVRVPQRGDLPKVALSEVMKRRDEVTINLAIPSMLNNRANVSLPGVEGSTFRYHAYTAELPDENAAASKVPISLRRLNLSIRSSAQENENFDLLPIARIKHSASSAHGLMVDPHFIPPLLACEAWQPLVDDIIEEIRSKVRGRASLLAEVIRNRHVPIDSADAEDARLIRALDLLNRSCPSLDILASTPSLHPFTAYLALSELVGRFALYSRERLAPELPGYDHQGLGGCFDLLFQYLVSLVQDIGRLEFGIRDLVWSGTSFEMQAEFQPEWLEETWGLYLAVLADDLSATECADILGSAYLNLKIGSSERIEPIFRGNRPGVRYTLLSSQSQPRLLPNERGRYYLEIEESGEEWTPVLIARRLAIMIGTDLVRGEKGRDSTRLEIEWRNRRIRLGFRLYALQKPASAS
jgi:type VI secretion system protein ImpJ